MLIFDERRVEMRSLLVSHIGRGGLRKQGMAGVHQEHSGCVMSSKRAVTVMHRKTEQPWKQVDAASSSMSQCEVRSRLLPGWQGWEGALVTKTTAKEEQQTRYGVVTTRHDTVVPTLAPFADSNPSGIRHQSN